MADNQQDNFIAISYEFTFNDGVKKTFVVHLDDKTLDLVSEQGQDKKPDWALMSKFRCENCTLDKDKYEHCPVALNLSSLLENFKDVVSYDKVDLRVETPRRTYFNTVSVQAALSSLMGIYMVSNDCPVFNKLKPMVRYHMPFAGPHETAYRMISMYLMAQLFRQKQGKPTDWKLEELPDIFEDIKISNRNVCRKFKTVAAKDSLLNAVMILNSRVDFMSVCFNEGILEAIERDFGPYINED